MQKIPWAMEASVGGIAGAVLLKILGRSSHSKASFVRAFNFFGLLSRKEGEEGLWVVNKLISKRGKG